MPAPANVVPFREIGLVVALALAVYVLLALGSYHPNDPGYTVAGSPLVAVQNLAGKSGAYTADIVLTVFGWGAYLLPVCLLGAAVPLFLRHRRRTPWTWAEAPVRGGGFIAVLVATCLLMHLYIEAGVAMPAGAGGALGDKIAEVGLPVLNVPGLTLCALAVLAIGIQALLNYSWLNLLERIGRSVYAVARGIRFGAVFLAKALRRCAVALVRTERTPQRRPVAKRSRRSKSARRRTEPGVAAPSRAPTTIETPAKRTAPGYQPRMFDMKTTLELPDLDLLEDYDPSVSGGFTNDSLNKMAHDLERNLAEFGVEAKVKSVLPGPVVTRFELEPAPGLKVSKITSLVKDLARSLAVISVRVVEVIPGKSYVGVEIPNEQREVVRLKEILNSTEYRDANTPLTLALGKDIAGTPVMADIGRMPHLLVAGTTGSGKSVGINAMLLSMLYKAMPEQLRLILVDPKMLELSVYDGIPHLLTPVVTDMKDAAQALNWCIAEMERRYQLMAAMGVRNITGYNRRIDEGQSIGKPVLDPLVSDAAGEGDPAPALAKLPFIVVVIDEFADMMMIVGKKVEQLIARLAQKARAAGIHLVLATQRPSVNVVTGLIKANVPARISFQVSSAVDSRTVLDQGGAEQLLGYGDMLFLPPGTGMPTRVHGAFVSDEEVVAVTNDWKERGQPEYITDVLGGVDLDVPGTVDIGGDSDEPLYEEAVAFVQESGRASISAVQRRLRIGYNRAARLIEQMEEAGIVSAMNSNGTREVLVSPGRAD